MSKIGAKTVNSDQKTALHEYHMAFKSLACASFLVTIQSQFDKPSNIC